MSSAAVSRYVKRITGRSANPSASSPTTTPTNASSSKVPQTTVSLIPSPAISSPSQSKSRKKDQSVWKYHDNTAPETDDEKLAEQFGKPDANGVAASEEFKEDEGDEDNATGDEGDEDHPPVDLYAGRVAALQARGTKEPRPPYIESKWQDMYKLAKMWWSMGGKGLNSVQQNIVDELQKKIKKECLKLAGEKVKQKDGDCVKLIHDKAVELSEGSDPETQLSEAAANTQAVEQVKEMVANKLYRDFEFRQKLIQGQMKGIAATINEISLLEANPPTVGNTEEEAEYSEAMKEQQKDAVVAAIEAHVDSLRKLDQRIESHNIEHDLPKTVGRIPLETLQSMQSSWSQCESDTLAIEATKLQEFLEYRPLGAVLLQRMEDKEGPILKELAAPEPQYSGKGKDPVGSGSSGTTAKRRFNTPPTVTPELTVGSGSSSTAAKRGLNSSPLTKARQIAATPGTMEALRRSLAEDDVIEMFDYHDGKTEFGSHVATRPSYTDGFRFTRFIINAGTTQQPYHVVVQGNELRPGGAESLSKTSSKDTIFNLRDRKTQIRMDPTYLKKVGPCVVKSRSDSYKPRAGSRVRRPDTYVQLQYKDGKVEWLSRSEYVQLIGKKCAERHLETLTARYEQRTEYMRRCKQALIHPTTGAALSDSDRRNTPWLFPNCALSFSDATQSDTDTKENTDFQPELDGDSDSEP
ncbi:hypothetical protein NX059_012165 [Plenodomus lindquistii]|nr:hypothetical protein NX059_012165 [Plenodomus lindquistii]